MKDITLYGMKIEISGSEGSVQKYTADWTRTRQSFSKWTFTMKSRKLGRGFHAFHILKLSS
jgi:hypothetical protein